MPARTVDKVEGHSTKVSRMELSVEDASGKTEFSYVIYVIGANEAGGTHRDHETSFVTAGHDTQCCQQDRTSVLTPGKDWSMTENVSKQLQFATNITITTL